MLRKKTRHNYALNDREFSKLRTKEKMRSLSHTDIQGETQRLRPQQKSYVGGR